MKVGGAGDFVGVIVIQVAAGVNESLTDDGVSSKIEGNQYDFVCPKLTIQGVRAAQKVGGLLGGVVGVIGGDDVDEGGVEGVCNILVYL